MKFNRRNAMRATVAGVIGFFTGGASHPGPTEEVSCAECDVAPNFVIPESLTITISESAVNCERITFVNNTGGAGGGERRSLQGGVR